MSGRKLVTTVADSEGQLYCM